MGLGSVTTASGHLCLPLVLIAGVAHVLRIGLLVLVGAGHLGGTFYRWRALSDLKLRAE